MALGITAYVAMYPLLGAVVSAWNGSFSAIVGRLVTIRRDLAHETRFGVLARIGSFFATYGIPIAVAGFVYESLGGPIGRNVEPTWRNAGLLAVGGLLLIVSNSLVMLRPGRAMGLSWSRIARLYSIDSSIYLLTLPFSIIVTMSFHAFGIIGVVALLSQLIMAFAVTRKMAMAQAEMPGSAPAPRVADVHRASHLADDHRQPPDDRLHRVQEGHRHDDLQHRAARRAHQRAHARAPRGKQ